VDCGSLAVRRRFFHLQEIIIFTLYYIIFTLKYLRFFFLLSWSTIKIFLGDLREFFGVNRFPNSLDYLYYLMVFCLEIKKGQSALSSWIQISTFRSYDLTFFLPSWMILKIAYLWFSDNGFCCLDVLPMTLWCLNGIVMSFFK
jgi:hypothetical protein